MNHRVAVAASLVLVIAGAGIGVANAAPSHAPRAITLTVQMTYYDGHLDAIVNTDSSSRAQARTMGINYAPGLRYLKPTKFPKIYTVVGSAASGQATIMGSEPGESSYSPIWQEVAVKWSAGATPVLLTSDTQIDDLSAMNQLTQTPTDVLLNAPVIATDVTAGTNVPAPTPFKTFYDGHKDGMLATDISVETLAMQQHINFSPVLATVNPKKEPEIYIVRGKAASGQLMILGSQPGEAGYSPLWVETFVHWVHGASPKVIKSDTQIDKLEGKGLLKERGSTIILNCPVTSVG
jgi:hypothetical protein